MARSSWECGLGIEGLTPSNVLYHAMDGEVFASRISDYTANGGNAEFIFVCDAHSKHAALLISQILNNLNDEVRRSPRGAGLYVDVMDIIRRAQ